MGSPASGADLEGRNLDWGKMDAPQQAHEGGGEWTPEGLPLGPSKIGSKGEILWLPPTPQTVVLLSFWQTRETKWLPGGV